MYLEINGSIYRLLIEQEQGGWLIPYETPGAPVFLTRGGWGKRVAVSAEPDGPKTEAGRAEEDICGSDRTLLPVSQASLSAGCI